MPLSSGDTVVSELMKIESILETHTVTGDDDILIKVKTENTTTLEKLLKKIDSIKGILNTKTTVVLSSPAETIKIKIEQRPEKG